MTAVASKPMRLSTVRDCPLRAIYEATGAPARDTTERERRILWSGKRIGQDYLDMLEAGGTGPIEREIKIPWKHGIGHADGWIDETKTLIEVLSSAHASDEMIHSKLVQLVLYMRHKPDAQNGVLLIVNPRDYSDERVIVETGTDKYAGLLAEADERLAAIDRWHETGEQPARVCRKPADAIGHFCRHAEHCFDGWTPEPLPEIDTPDARAAALQFSQAKQREKEAEAILTTAREQRLVAQEKVAELDPPVGTVKVGPFELKRIHYAGRRTFNLTLAEKDSRLADDLLNEFVKVGDPYDVFQIKRVDTGPAIDVVQDEEVPF